MGECRMRTQLHLPALVASLVVLVSLSVLGNPTPTSAQAPEVPETSKACVMCHTSRMPGLVDQWKASLHAEKGIGCADCHGTAHNSPNNVAKAQMPSAGTCGGCHDQQFKQFSAGKHALAEDAMNAIPMLALQPPEVVKMGCYSCHWIGRKSADGTKGKCDSCHTRHLFSKEEARKPEACGQCHMGEDHAQYEMWETSKHGSVHASEPDTGRAPVCQTCHMPDGDHNVLTAWGFLALRQPEDDPKWQEDTLTIIKALGPWGTDEAGMADRVNAIKALRLARLTQEEFQERREKMLSICSECHSRAYAQDRLEAADAVIQETDALMAEAIQVVQGLYDKGILPKKPDGPKHPDMLLFYESPTPLEQELYRMFLFHRQKVFQGAFHQNPDYMHWYGWAPMKSSLNAIKSMAEGMR